MKDLLNIPMPPKLTYEDLKILQKDTIKLGTLVMYHPYPEKRNVGFVVQNNSRNIWIEQYSGDGPPYDKTIEWKDLIGVYLKEDYPEMYL